MTERNLSGRLIAVPESRELDVFATMLERRGARVLRCPLVSICDAPDPRPVLGWIRRFNDGEIEDLVLMTGEGLRRLLSCIDAHEPSWRAEFLAQLARVRKITRGPKPARVLRELGMRPDLAAQVPTTTGVMEALGTLALKGRVVGVQLYGSDPNRPLVDYIESAGGVVRTVAPYIYADDAADSRVHELLSSLHAREIDAIAFTSSSQVDRLFTVGGDEYCRAALSGARVAAVGPVVAAALAARGVTVSLAPQDSFFMKPLTTALVDALGPAETT